jgi:hypothetical protein
MLSRKKIYGALTVISTILRLPGLIIQVYAFFDEQAEKDRIRQEEERRQAEEARKSEADKLREQIDYAQSVVPNCYFATSESPSRNVSSVLDRAERELILNENISGSKMLYESVKQEVTVCAPPSPALPSETSTMIETLIETPILFLSALIFVPLTGVFGFLWYRASKKQS